MHEKYYFRKPELKTTTICTYFIEKILEIKEKYNIDTIVETGIFEGDSALFFSQIVPNYHGIEIVPDYLEKTKNLLEEHNIQNFNLHHGNSPIVLLNLMHKIDAEKTIFFLDAHWQRYWPLKDEIDTISRNKGIIVIHDAQVPDHPELGYDVWGGNTLNYEYVKENLNDWSKTHRVEYSTKSDSRLQRGTMYVYPN